MIGEKLAHFRIIEKLGEGGMGVVYRAEDQKLGRHVALKVLHSEFVTDEERRKRFIREARTAAAVSHPHIAAVHQIDEAEGVIFIAMELIEGKTLKTLIGGRPLQSDDCLRLAIEMAEGLARAHEANIVHRDLKPENVSIGPDGHAKILDFGLAKLYDGPEDNITGDSSGEQTLSAAVTREGRILGTVAYMSPEQARGLAVDARSDVFTFGVLLYEMATGKSPFQGATITDTLTAILRDEQPPVAQFNPQIPAELERIMSRCLEKDPEQRYQNAAEILADLRMLKRLSDSQPVPLVSDSIVGLRAQRPTWKRPAFWAAAIVLAVTAAVGAPFISRWIGSVDSVALAEDALAVLPFENLQDAGDPQRLGQILQELIIADLSELATPRVLSSQRLFDIQKQLGRKERSTIDRDMASEVARRAGATTMLTGSLSQLNENRLLTFQLIDVRDGTVIKSERLDGADLYAMVDDLTDRVRDDLGVTLAGSGAAELAVKERTSGSLDAYQAFLGGVDLLNALDFDEAVKQFERAVAIDPSFGQAYYKLALARWWSRSIVELEQGLASGDPGAELRQMLESEVKLSRKDRLLAEAFLALVELHYPDALGQFEQIVQKYPDEKEAWYGLGEAMFHGPGGIPARLKALDPFEKAIELDPAFTLAYYHVVDLYIMDRRFEEGIERVRSFIAQDPDNPDWYLAWVRAVIGKGDAQEIDAAVEESLSRIDNPEEQRYLLKGAAMTFRGKGDAERSEELLQRALRIDSGGDDEPLISSIGDTAADKGEFERAERLYMQVLESKPGFGPAVNGLFNVLVEQRRFDDTIRLARGLAKEQPQHVAALGHWMTAAIHAGDEEEALTAWREIMARHESGDFDMEGFAKLWQRRLRAYFNASNHARIVELCDEAIEGAPEDRRGALYTWRGWNHLSLGHLDAATADLEAARRLETSEPDLELAQAWVATLSGDGAAAVRLADRVDELAGGKPWSRARQIEMRLRTGDMESAEELIKENAELFVQGKEAKVFYGELSTAFFGAGLLERAEEAARRAVGPKPGPKDLDRLVDLAWVVMRRGNNGEARRLLQQGLEISPQNARLLYTLAVSDLLEGDAEAAERRVGELLAEGPVRAEGFFIRSYALAQQGRFAEAEKDARRAFSMMPGRAGHEMLSWILVAGNIDIEQGLDLAEAALKMPEHFHAEMFKLPFTAPAEHSAGLAYLKLGRKDEAVEMLERAAALRPDRKLIRDDLRRARPLVSRKGS